MFSCSPTEVLSGSPTQIFSGSPTEMFSNWGALWFSNSNVFLFSNWYVLRFSNWSAPWFSNSDVLLFSNWEKCSKSAFCGSLFDSDSNLKSNKTNQEPEEKSTRWLKRHQKTFEGEKQAYFCWFLNKYIHCMFVEGKPRTVFFLQTLYLRYLSRRLKKLRMGECHAKCRALVKAINIFGWLNSDQHQGICCFLVLICFDWRGNSGNARKKTFFLQEGFPKSQDT